MLFLAAAAVRQESVWSMAPAPTWDAARGVFVGDKAASNVAVPDPLWIFGYGSLVYAAAAYWQPMLGRSWRTPKAFARSATTP